MDNEIIKSYYTIGEVSEMIHESPSLIRFWEKEFPQLNPHKTDGGTRKYSYKDIQLLKLIHHLVKEKGYTLEGARDYMKRQPNITDNARMIESLKRMKSFLQSLKSALE